MFDIGFSELIIISLIALIVIGPKRLPSVARTLGHLAGRLRRYVDDVKADISREAELDELRKMRDNMQEAATSFETAVQGEIRKNEGDLNAAASAAAGDTPQSADAVAGAAAEPSKVNEPPKLTEKAG
jgi:sec-independent protein translocase protein TatB